MRTLVITFMICMHLIPVGLGVLSAWQNPRLPFGVNLALGGAVQIIGIPALWIFAFADSADLMRFVVWFSTWQVSAELSAWWMRRVPGSGFNLPAEREENC